MRIQRCRDYVVHGTVSFEPLFQLEDCCASLDVVLLFYCIFWPLGLSLSKMLKTPNNRKSEVFNYIKSATKLTWLYYMHKFKMRPKMLCHNAYTFGANQTIVRCTAANKNWEAITAFVDVFVQHRWKKNSSFFFFSVFIFSMPKVITIVEQYVLGHKYSLSSFQSSF